MVRNLYVKIDTCIDPPQLLKPPCTKIQSCSRAAAVCVGALSLGRRARVWLQDTATAHWESSAWPPRRWRWSCSLIMWLSPPSTTLPTVSQVYLHSVFCFVLFNQLSTITYWYMALWMNFFLQESRFTLCPRRSRDPLGGKRWRGGRQQPCRWRYYSGHWRPQRSSSHCHPLCEWTGQPSHREGVTLKDVSIHHHTCRSCRGHSQNTILFVFLSNQVEFWKSILWMCLYVV